MRVVPGKFAVALVLAVGASGHLHGHLLVLDRLNTDPVDVGPRPKTDQRLDVPAKRMTVLLVDGLRGDVAIEDETFRRLAKHGCLGRLRATYPTFTYPMLTTIATGMEPIYHGVRMNHPFETPNVDSFPKRARAAGLAVNVDSDWEPFSRLLVLPEDTSTSTAKYAGLTFVYHSAVDEAGHRDGADSDGYRTAVAKAAKLAETFATARPDDAALVILSDHGHRDEGGHGGLEPGAQNAFFLAIGAPFVAGSTVTLTMQDVAPTLAVALGVEIPNLAFGRVIAPAVGRPDGAFDVDDDRPKRRAVWYAENEDAAKRRLVIAIVLVVAFAIFLVVRYGVTWRDALSPLLFCAGFLGPYFAMDYELSWSIPRGYGGFLIETLVFAAIGTALARLPSSKTRRRHEGVAAAIIMGGPYSVTSAYVGLDLSWLAGPDATWGVMWMSTVMFYGCLTAGFYAIRAPATGRPLADSTEAKSLERT